MKLTTVEPTATPPAVAAICLNIDGCCGAPTAEDGAPTVAGGDAAAVRAGTFGVGAARDCGATLLCEGKTM